MDYDLIISGGRVIDGTGADAIRADVAISNGRISRVSATWAMPTPKKP